RNRANSISKLLSSDNSWNASRITWTCSASWATTSPSRAITPRGSSSISASCNCGRATRWPTTTWPAAKRCSSDPIKPCGRCAAPSNWATATFATCARTATWTRSVMIRASASCCASTRIANHLESVVRGPWSVAFCYGPRTTDYGPWTMDTLSRGTGALFADPSANRAREYFATKPRALVNKVTTVAEAVARLVHDGDYLAVGGFGCARIPTAVVHE